MLTHTDTLKQLRDCGLGGIYELRRQGHVHQGDLRAQQACGQSHDVQPSRRCGPLRGKKYEELAAREVR